MNSHPQHRNNRLPRYSKTLQLHASSPQRVGILGSVSVMGWSVYWRRAQELHNFFLCALGGLFESLCYLTGMQIVSLSFALIPDVAISVSDDGNEMDAVTVRFHL